MYRTVFLVVALITVSRAACCKGWEKRGSDRSDNNTDKVWGCSLCNCKDIKDEGLALTTACNALTPPAVSQYSGYLCCDALTANGTNFGCESCSCRDDDGNAALTAKCQSDANKQCSRNKMLECFFQDQQEVGAKILNKTYMREGPLDGLCDINNKYASCVKQAGCGPGAALYEDSKQNLIGCPPTAPPSSAPVPTSVGPKPEPGSPTAAAEPGSPTAAAEPGSPTAAAEPESPTAAPAPTGATGATPPTTLEADAGTALSLPVVTVLVVALSYLW